MTDITDPVFPFGLRVHEVDFLRWVAGGCSERIAIDIYRNVYFVETIQKIELLGLANRQVAWRQEGDRIVFVAPFVLTRKGRRVVGILNLEKR